MEVVEKEGVCVERLEADAGPRVRLQARRSDVPFGPPRLHKLRALARTVAAPQAAQTKPVSRVDAQPDREPLLSAPERHDEGPLVHSQHPAASLPWTKAQRHVVQTLAEPAAVGARSGQHPQPD